MVGSLPIFICNVFFLIYGVYAVYEELLLVGSFEFFEGFCELSVFVHWLVELTGVGYY